MTTSNLIERLKATGCKVAEIAFLKAPTYPAIVYFIDNSGRGDDDKNHIINVKVRLELYTQKIDKEVENLIGKNVLFDVEYESDSTYEDSQKEFIRYYEFSFIEKI